MTLNLTRGLPMGSLPHSKGSSLIAVARLGVEELVIGYDHGFGRDRSGDPDTLVKIGAELALVRFDLEDPDGAIRQLL